jgi:hypothetical protein
VGAGRGDWLSFLRLDLFWGTAFAWISLLTLHEYIVRQGELIICKTGAFKECGGLAPLTRGWQGSCVDLNDSEVSETRLRHLASTRCYTRFKTTEKFYAR